MKKLTLNQKNLEIIITDGGECDFCGESDKEFIKGMVFNYKDECKKEQKFIPLICGDCIRQLNNLIK